MFGSVRSFPIFSISKDQFSKISRNRTRDYIQDFLITWQTYFDRYVLIILIVSHGVKLCHIDVHVTLETILYVM